MNSCAAGEIRSKIRFKLTNVDSSAGSTLALASSPLLVSRGCAKLFIGAVASCALESAVVDAGLPVSIS